MMASHRRLSAVLMLPVLTLIADQASKSVLIGVLEDRMFEPVDVTGFFRLVMVWNRGISFGMLGGEGSVLPWLLAAFALAVAAGLVVWMRRRIARIQRIGAGLIAGGAAGNAIDRIRHGAVADFFDVHVGGWSWSAFNVADSAITLGVILLIVHALLTSGSNRKVGA